MLVVAREREQGEEEMAALRSNIGFNSEIANYSCLVEMLIN